MSRSAPKKLLNHGDRIVGLLRQGVELDEAAERCGVARRTVLSWLRKGRNKEGKPYEDFLRDYESALDVAFGLGATASRASEVGVDASLDRFLRAQLEDLLRLASSAERAGSFQAAAAFHRQIRDVRAALEEARRGGNTEAGDIPAEEFRRTFEEAVEQWPEDLFEIVLAKYKERHRIDLVVVLEGGKRKT